MPLTIDNFAGFGGASTFAHRRKARKHALRRIRRIERKTVYWTPWRYFRCKRRKQIEVIPAPTHRAAARQESKG